MSHSGRRLALALVLATLIFALIISPASSTQPEDSGLAGPGAALVRIGPPRPDGESVLGPPADDQTLEEAPPAVEPAQPTGPAPRPAPRPVANASPRPGPVVPARPAAKTSHAPVHASSAAGPRYRTVRMRVTAYCPCKLCCGHSAKGITASGKTIYANGSKFVAADTRLLPFNTKVSIPGYNNGLPVPVLDTGGAIKGNRLDVYFHSHSTAKKWGSRWLTCRVYRD